MSTITSIAGVPPAQKIAFEYLAGRARVAHQEGDGILVNHLCAAAFGRLLIGRAFDAVLVVTNPPSNGFGAWLYWKARHVPYIYLIHDLYPDIAIALQGLKPESIVARLARVFQRQWLHRAHVVVALGRCMKQRLQKVYKIPAHRIQVITNWADSDSILGGSIAGRFREANGLSGFLVLYAGNFSRYVNFDQILTAAKLLRFELDITFILIGDGSRKEELIGRIQSEKLTNVRLLQKVSRSVINEVLASCDLPIVSLGNEMLGLGVPSKLYSILAAGRPVLGIVPTGSEVALVIDEDQCGVNVADGDSENLAQQILNLKKNKVLFDKMCVNARASFENRYTLDNAVELYFNLVQRIVNRA